MLTRKINIPLGTRFGNLTVVAEAGRSPKGDVLWDCFCDCKGKKIVRSFALRKGAVTCCGHCPPTVKYEFYKDFVVGKVFGGVEFVIDADDYAKVKSYQWHKDQLNYITSIVKGKTIKIHALIMGFPQGREIDHIDGNVLNNRRANLRVCTHQQNMWNQKKRSTNTSGYKGVFLRSDGKKYVSSIKVDGKAIHLGSFVSKIDAALAYDHAARTYFGEFASLNFPDEASAYG